MPDYIDTSAAAKLVIAEPESTALREYLLAQPTPPFTSDLTRTELIRATRRHSPGLATHARAVLDTFTIVRIPPDIFERAALLEPPELRTLDAVHLAVALTAGDDLSAVITYDDRFAQAATSAGISTLAPGQTD